MVDFCEDYLRKIDTDIRACLLTDNSCQIRLKLNQRKMKKNEWRF